MPALTIDRRDFEFLLFEQFQLERCLAWERYRDMSRETLSMALAEGFRLATDVLAPVNAEADKFGTRLEGGKVQIAPAFHRVFKTFAEGGWIAPTHDPEWGGMGLPLPVGVALHEAFMAACSSFMFVPGLTTSAGHLIENFASAELKALVVPKLYSGQWAGTMCLTEPHAGTAVGDLKTQAFPIDGQRYKIRGNKIFISAGDHDLSENIVHLVLARVEGDAPGTKGISLFLVPKLRFDATGQLGIPNDVTVTAIEHKMGIHASPTCALAFGENDACEGYLIGQRQAGITYMFQMMNEARLMCAVQGAASANATHQLALAYAKERVQGTRATDSSGAGPRVAIIEHPDVRRNLMFTRSVGEGLRAMVLEAAFLAEESEHAPDAERRAMARDLLDLVTPIAKAYSTDLGFRATEVAMQVHGGYGYIREYGVEQYMRDVKIASIYEGTNGVQALDLLGRKLRLKGGGLFLAWLQDTNERIEKLRDVPALAAEVTRLEAAKNRAAEVVFSLPEMGKNDPSRMMLAATPFLEMMGQIQVSRLLLESAAIASRALAEANAADARFYQGKIATAQYFVRTVLPHAAALADEIAGAGRVALDAPL